MDCENLITLLGNVGKAPETQTFSNGGMVSVITLATSEGGYTKKATGEQVPEVTHWHRVAGYGKLAEFIQRYIRKGSRLYVRGKLKYYEMQTPGGDKYTASYIEADKVTQLDRRPVAEPLSGDVSVAELKRRYPEMPLDDDGQPYRWADGRVRTLPFKPGERAIKWYGGENNNTGNGATTGTSGAATGNGTDGLSNNERQQ